MSSTPSTPNKKVSKILDKSPSKNSNKIIFPDKEKIDPNNIKINIEIEAEEEIKKNNKVKNSNIYDKNIIKYDNNDKNDNNKKDNNSTSYNEKSKKKSKLSDGANKAKKKKVKINDDVDIIQVECWKQYNCDMSEINIVKKNSKYKCCYIM